MDESRRNFNRLRWIANGAIFVSFVLALVFGSGGVVWAIVFGGLVLASLMFKGFVQFQLGQIDAIEEKTA